MEDPYQPPKECTVEKAPSAIWSKWSRWMVILLPAATTLTGMMLAWLAEKYSVALRSAEDAILTESLQFAWNDPQLPFQCGCFLGAAALAFLHLEKHMVAFILSLIGAGIVFGWAAILALSIGG